MLKGIKCLILVFTVMHSLGCGITLRKHFLHEEIHGEAKEAETRRSEGGEVPAGDTSAKGHLSGGEGLEPVDPEPVSPLRVGVILGPGGGRGFAHTGVLRELLKAQIPIDSIVGMEWGALVGGMFASRGQIHSTEWELYKLQKKDFFGKKSFFQSEVQPIGISRLQSFIDGTFGETKFNEMKIHFACPALSVWSGILQWQNRGSLKKAIYRCWPYPPIFKPKGAWVAAVFALPEAVSYLRDRGMDVILFVNVIGEGDLLTTNQVNSDYKSSILWQVMRRSLGNKQTLKDLGVEVIRVPTKKFKIYSFDNRRSLVSLGEQAGRQAAKRLWHKYAF